MTHKILINIFCLFTIIKLILTENIKENTISTDFNMNVKCNSDKLIYTVDPKNCQCYFVSCGENNMQLNFKMKFKCIESFYWDQRVLTCVSYNDHCEENPYKKDAQHESNKSNIYPKKVFQTTKQMKVDSSICENGGIYHPDPYNCHYFIQCSNGRPYRFQCAEPLFWNQEILSCDWNYKHCIMKSLIATDSLSTQQTTKTIKLNDNTSSQDSETTAANYKGSKMPNMTSNISNTTITDVSILDQQTIVYTTAMPSSSTRDLDKSADMKEITTIKEILTVSKIANSIQSDQTTVTYETTLRDEVLSEITFPTNFSSSKELNTSSETTLSDRINDTPGTVMTIPPIKNFSIPEQTTTISKSTVPLTGVSSFDQTTAVPLLSDQVTDITSITTVVTHSTDTSFSDQISATSETTTNIDQIIDTSISTITDETTEKTLTADTSLADRTTVIFETLPSDKLKDITEIAMAITEQATVAPVLNDETTVTMDISTATTSPRGISFPEETTIQTTLSYLLSGKTTELKDITLHEALYTMLMTPSKDSIVLDQTTVTPGTISSNEASKTIEITDSTGKMFIIPNTDDCSFDKTTTNCLNDNTTTFFDDSTKKMERVLNEEDIFDEISVPANTTAQITIIDKGTPSEVAVTTPSSDFVYNNNLTPLTSTVMPITLFSSTPLKTQTSSVTLDPQICADDQIYHADEYDNQYFIQCTNKTPRRFKCTEPYIWNQNILSCTWIEQKCFTEIHTIPNPSIENPTTSIVPFKTSIKCYFDDTYIPDPSNCHVFYHCKDGLPFQKICPSNLFWDPHLLACSWSDHNCYINKQISTTVETVDSATSYRPFIKSGQNKFKTSYNKRIICKPGDTYLADPSNCNVFYHCSNGVPFKKTCPSNLFWDPQLLICNWSDQNCYNYKEILTQQSNKKLF